MLHFTQPKFGKLNRKVISTIIIILVLIIFLGTSIFIVDQTEQAVITRFGKYITTKGPGLQFKLPFGIDQNYTVNVRTVQTQEFGFRSLRGGSNPAYTAQTGESTMLTGDLNIVDVEWIIQYRIVDPRAWVFNVNERIPTIRDVSRSVINMLVGDRAIMDIMGIERSAIEAAALMLMNETFGETNWNSNPPVTKGYGLGIDVIAVRLQNVTPPSGVQEAFEDVNKAMQDLERLVNEGQQVYNEAIPRARGEAERLVQVARGYATERVNRARGDVARFNSVFEEFRQAPDVTRQRLYYEMVEEVFKNDEGMTVIDRSLTNVIPLLNLGQGGR